MDGRLCGCECLRGSANGSADTTTDDVEADVLRTGPDTRAVGRCDPAFLRAVIPADVHRVRSAFLCAREHKGTDE